MWCVEQTKEEGVNDTLHNYSILQTYYVNAKALSSYDNSAFKVNTITSTTIMKRKRYPILRSSSSDEVVHCLYKRVLRLWYQFTVFWFSFWFLVTCCKTTFKHALVALYIVCYLYDVIKDMYVSYVRSTSLLRLCGVYILSDCSDYITHVTWLVHYYTTIHI